MAAALGLLLSEHLGDFEKTFRTLRIRSWLGKAVFARQSVKGSCLWYVNGRRAGSRNEMRIRHY
jgi:hypothetical protein